MDSLKVYIFGSIERDMESLGCGEAAMMVYTGWYAEQRDF